MTSLDYCPTFKFGNFGETVRGDALLLPVSVIICVGTRQLLCQVFRLSRGPVGMDEPVFLRLNAGDVVVQAHWCVPFCDLWAVTSSGVTTFLSLSR